MSKLTSIKHRFVTEIPETIEPGILYISIEFGTMIHLCCCGCNNEVVSPLGLTDWGFAYDGSSITVSPSVGNWNFPCKSHYRIIKNFVVWKRQWTHAEIQAGRTRDRIAKRQVLFESQNKGHSASTEISACSGKNC